MDDQEKETIFNRSLERALQILDTFESERRDLGLAQLSEALGLSKATVLRLCSTLIKYGYLKQNPQSRKYFLGIKLFQLGSIVFSTFSLRNIADPFLRELQRSAGKTVFLGILRDGHLLYIDKKEGPENAIRFTSSIGTRHPPYWGMLGPVLMAHLPESEVRRLLVKNPLKPTARRSVTGQSEFREWLNTIKRQGFVVEAETALEGIAGIAAPVRDFRGKVIAAVGISFIRSSVDAEDVPRMIAQVTKTAAVISKELGFIDKKRGTTPQCTSRMRNC
jgi:DNA-binding IclR family transcriptional regulator